MNRCKYLLLLTLFFVSCVEHTITVRVHPDGFYELEMKTSGDSTDVMDNDFPHPPSDGIWMKTVKQSIEEGDTIWTMTTKGYLSGTTRFIKDTLSFAPVHHPIHLVKTDGWISTQYTFYQTFSGRQAFKKYPVLADAIRSNAQLDSIRWLPEAMNYLCNKAVDDLQAGKELQPEPIIFDRIKNHFDQYFIRVQEEKLLKELEDDRTKFFRRILTPFLSQLPPDFVQKMAESMLPYEDELNVTMGLRDDSFKYQVFMPGRITSTNADAVRGDTLMWEFDLEDFLNDDLSLEAASVIYSKTKFQKTVLFSFAALLIVVVILWKTSMRNRQNAI